MLVSIVVPTYNNGNKIQKLIETLHLQTYPKYELIIVDDGSIDDTRTIVEHYRVNDERIKYYYQENKGPGAARNIGLDNAKGEFVFFADSDDSFRSSMLEDMINFAQVYDADVVQFGYFYETKSNEIKEVQHCSKILESTEIEDIHLHYASSKNCDVYLWSKLFRRKIIGSTRFSEFYYTEDQEFIVRIINEVNKVLVVPNSYYIYKYNPNSIVRSSFNMKKLDSIKATRKIIDFYELENSKISGFYARKMCLYYIKFFNDSSLEHLNKTDVFVDFNQEYKFYYKLYKNSLAYENTKLLVKIYLFSFIFFKNLTRLMIKVRGE